MAKMRCPECRVQAQLPDELIGKRIRCPECGTAFVATAGTGILPAPPQKKSSTKMGVPMPAKPKTVVAYPQGQRAGGGGGLIWIIAGVAAFLLPVMAAGGFVVVKLALGRSAPPGELYAGIEVGSKGVNYAVFEVFPHATLGHDYRVVLSQSGRTDIIKGMERSGKFDPARLKMTAEAIRKCCEKLTDEDKIPANRIFIVGSGGLTVPIRSRKNLGEEERTKLITQNQATLTQAVKEATGKTMDFVDLDEEAALQFDGVVEPDQASKSIYVDVGSGGTRGGYKSSAGEVRNLTTVGVKQFSESVARKRGGLAFVNAARNLSMPEVRMPLRVQLKSDPGMAERQRVYLAGGIVWVMATCLHPKEGVSPPEKNLYIDLSAADIEEFARATAKSGNFLEKYRAPDDLTDAEKEKLTGLVKTMRKIFTGEEQIAGAEILRSVSAELKFSEKTLRFYRHSNNAWLMSYIAKNGKLKRGPTK
jgi:hypothetical protein